MKKLVLSAFLAVAAIAAMPAQVQAQCNPQAPAPIGVSGQITANTTWTSNNIYLLNGFVYVRNGATLTIEPGTIIKGDKVSKGTLIIEQGARIIANGTAARPIVFTSNEPVGQRNRGDWGGVIICGRAPVNLVGSPVIEGGVGSTFGGNQPADDSGILRYVRIEFPGVAFQPNSEINGLTLGGVGSGTTIEYVQVYGSGDDSFEWFGGTVNARYLVAVAATDDDFDSDNGYSGNVQFAVTVRDPAEADVSGSTAIESDNNAGGSTATPQTSAVFSNISAFLANRTATNFTRAMHLRRNTAISVLNSVFTGWPQGLTLDGSATQANATSGALVLKNNVLAGMTVNYSQHSGGTYNVQAYFENASRGNATYADASSLALNADNFGPTTPAGASPNFLLPTASPLNTGASFADAKVANSFFTPVAYRGAFGPAGTTNWAAGWTNFNPQLTCYNRPGSTLSARSGSDQLQGLAVYPNPSTEAANLSFELKRGSAATVRVLDLTGREVATVVAGKTFGAGPQVLALPAGLPGGVYVATITTSETSQSVRFVVSK
ncbi:hypothetical protein GCM10023185_08420 [Hymenobacter saemangeumensis]|uniref:Secretion system C-terminal sorting domain-containing protein n=1 Tax=Hymenobacter saemangeumensis TaxID=1084522 RepID=A0ABP8I3C8_9BACT